MARDTFTGVTFVVDGETVETVNGDFDMPREGERVEVGGKFDDDGNRIDPGTADYSEWHDAEYRTFLEGTVDSVRRHYASSYDRSELTVYVELEDVEYDDYDYE